MTAARQPFCRDQHTGARHDLGAWGTLHTLRQHRAVPRPQVRSGPEVSTCDASWSCVAACCLQSWAHMPGALVRHRLPVFPPQRDLHSWHIMLCFGCAQPRRAGAAAAGGAAGRAVQRHRDGGAARRDGAVHGARSRRAACPGHPGARLRRRLHPGAVRTLALLNPWCMKIWCVCCAGGNGVTISPYQQRMTGFPCQVGFQPACLCAEFCFPVE